MRKRRLLSAWFLIFLSSALLANVPTSFTGKTAMQVQPERPKFYALQVVFEKNVQDAKDSLGAPDGRYAEIFPGGQLIVLMEKKLYPFPFFRSWLEGGGGLADSGSVAGKGETDFSLEGWFLEQTTQCKPHYVWRSLILSPSGFCVWLECKAGVNMIRIANTGTKSLFVDAVLGYSRRAERK